MRKTPRFGYIALALVLLSLGAAPCLADPEIQNSRVEPSPFSPDGLPPADRDTTWIHYNVTEPADSVIVRIHGESITPFQLTIHRPALAGPYRDTWDGRDDGGTLVPDGDYAVRLFLYDEGAIVDAVDQGVSIDTVAPSVSLIPPFPESPISPDGDGIHDRLRIGIDIEFADHDDVTSGEIRDHSGNRISSLLFDDGSAVKFGGGIDTLSWSGESEEGTLTEGLYLWTVRTVDPAENRDELTGAVHVDLLPPKLTLNSGPTGGLRFSNPDTSFTFSGTATDTISQVIDLEFSPDAGATWIDIYDGSEENVEWNRTQPFSAYRGEGWYSYRVRGTDGQAHTNEPGETPAPLNIRVFFDTSVPTHLLSTAIDQAVADGDTIRLQSTWSEDSLAIDVDFAPLVDTFSPNDVMVRSMGSGLYEITYPVPAETGIEIRSDVAIPITARDGANPPVEVQAAVSLTLDNAPPMAESYELLTENVVANGDSVVVVLTADEAGYEVLADFTRIDSDYVLGDESVDPLEGARYRIAYAISSTNTRGDGLDTSIPVTLIDPAKNTTVDGGFLLSLVNRSSAPLTEATVRPSVVNTRVTPLEISYELMAGAWGDSLDTQITIHESESDTLVRELLDATQGADRYILAWDGKTSRGDHAPDGGYRAKVEARAGQEIGRFSVEFRIDSAPPRLQNLYVFPTTGALTPNGDGLRDSLTVAASVIAGDLESNRTVVVIRDPNNTTIAHMHLDDSDSVFVGSGRPFFAWGGAGATNDGTYRFQIRSLDDALDLAGNPVNGDSLDGTMEVDLNGPEIQVDQGDSAGFYSFPFLLSGTAQDPAGVTTVEYSQDEGLSWTATDVTGDSTTCEWSFQFDPEEPLKYRYQVLVRGLDGLGHITGVDGTIEAAQIDLHRDTDPPVFIEVSVDPWTAANGDTLTVLAILDDADVQVTADFSRVDSDFDTSGVVTWHEPGSADYLFTWAISKDNSRTPGTHPILLRATDGLHPTSVDSSATVNLRGDGRSEVLVPPRWDPGDGILFRLDEPAHVSVEIFNLTSERIRKLDAAIPAAPTQVRWDLKNQHGTSVNNGPYLCRISIVFDSDGRKREILRPTVVIR